MKVAFVTPWDIDDPRAWSGVIQPMVKSLEGRHEVVKVSTRGVVDSIVDKVACRLLDRRFGRRYLVGHAIATSIKRGKELTRRINDIKPDLVCCVVASQDLAFVKLDVPVISVSDMTLARALDYYGDFSSLNPMSSWQARVISKRSAARTQRVLAATQWVKRSLIDDDGFAPEHVRLALFGPGIQDPQVRQQRPDASTVKLLSVVSNWHRKGGDRALGVYEQLRQLGVDVELTMVGALDGDVPQGVTTTGRISAQELAGLYRSHDALLELARANASGVTLTDATVSGLPTIATDTGGVSSIVDDGVTGVLVANDDDTVVDEACAAIVANRDRFQAMSLAGIERGKRELSWDTWADAFDAALSELTRL